MLPRGARRFRVPAWRVAELICELRARDLRYGAARALLPQRLAHQVLLAMEASGDSPDDRVQDAVARSRVVRSYVESFWPALDPAKLVSKLLSDADFLAHTAGGVLDDREQALLRWPRAPKSPRSAPWSPADAVLVDEAADLLERVPSVGHVVLDEAQDLSPMQLRAVGRRCATSSATVLGDVAQGTTPWATPSWADALTHLGKPEARVTELTRGYRVPREVIAYAARLLPAIAPGLAPATSVRADPGALAVRRVGDVDAALLTAVGDALGREGSIGVIAADAVCGPLSEALARGGIPHQVLGRDEHTEHGRVVVVPATLAKGLEYDRVVVVEPAAIAAAEPRGLRRLYVVLTRAVSGLTVVHARSLPGPLADGADAHGRGGVHTVALGMS